MVSGCDCHGSGIFPSGSRRYSTAGTRRLGCGVYSGHGRHWVTRSLFSLFLTAACCTWLHGLCPGRASRPRTPAAVRGPDPKAGWVATTSASA
eukprot:scaffold1746_cov121-Isochrysis_galbana.AAC.7